MYDLRAVVLWLVLEGARQLVEQATTTPLQNFLKILSSTTSIVEIIAIIVYDNTFCKTNRQEVMMVRSPMTANVLDPHSWVKMSALCQLNYENTLK